MKVNVKIGDVLEINRKRIVEMGGTVGFEGVWSNLNGSVVSKIEGMNVHYITKDNICDWVGMLCFDDGLVSVKNSKNKVPKKKLDSLKKKIISEIKANPEFAKQFSNIQKEVESWSETQVINWK